MLLSDSVTRESLIGVLGGVKPAGAVDQARQAVHAATGLARVETAGLHPIDDCYASELLDGKTCGPCQQVDGKQYKTLADATLDYPAGYYAGCAGSARCRGTLLFLFTPDE